MQGQRQDGRDRVGEAHRRADREYLALLVLLLLGFVLQSTSVLHGWGIVVSDFVITLSTAAVFVVLFRHEPVGRALALTLGAAALLAHWAQHAMPQTGARYLSIADHGLLALFLACALYVILRDLFRRRRTGETNIFGALTGYLLAAAAFSHLLIVAYLVAPGSFSVAQELVPHMAKAHALNATFLYYSLTQLLTIGYSDITTLTAPATTLCALESLFGVFYLAVVVSQFVAQA